MLKRVQIAILLGLSLATNCVHGQVGTDVDQRLRLSNEGRWSDLVAGMVDQRASAVKFLKAVVNNENTATSARVRAIELLGVLGTAESAAVLLDNLSFRRAIWMKTDEDMLKEFPCTLALIKMGWAVIPEVFEFVKSPRQDLEIFQLFVLLHKMPGGSTARRLLEEELEVATEDIHKENLERLLDSIK